MGVERGEVELAGDEEEIGPHGREAGVASGLAFGGLEEPVEGLDEAVGLAGLGPSDDAVEMRADHPGDLLHRRDLGTQNIGAPLFEHGGDDVDLLAFEDFAQMLAVKPGARGAFARCLGDQGVEIGPAFGGQAATILEQCPAQSLEAWIGPLFETPGLIDGGGRMGDDVELVEGDAGVGQMLGDAPGLRRGRLLMKAVDMSMLTERICSGAPLCSGKCSAKRAMVLASFPSVTNTTLRASVSAAMV